MTIVENAAEFFEAIEQKRWDKVRQHLSPDFQFFGPFPEPSDTEEWIQFQEALVIAFPDWSFGLKELTQSDHKVTAKLHITGTHQGPLELPGVPIPKIPATGMKLDMPDEKAHIHFKEDFISELHVLPQQGGGGLGALMAKLGLM